VCVCSIAKSIGIAIAVLFIGISNNPGLRLGPFTYYIMHDGWGRDRDFVILCYVSQCYIIAVKVCPVCLPL